MYSITMNNKPSDYSPIEVLYDLDALVKFMLAKVEIHALGPVIERDYYVNYDTRHYGVVFKQGLHRITTDADGYPIAYQGPGEEA